MKLLRDQPPPRKNWASGRFGQVVEIGLIILFGLASLAFLAFQRGSFIPKLIGVAVFWAILGYYIWDTRRP